MKIEAATPEEYINQLPEDRIDVMTELRKIINENIPEKFEETISYNMLAWVIPHSVYPDGYHCNPKQPLPFINIASQKNFIALYHLGLYADQSLQDWFVAEYPKHAKRKLDMGKSCIRFKKMDDIPFNLIASLVSKMTAEQWITFYEKSTK